MSNAASDYAENLVLEYLLTGNSVTRPSNLHVALFNASVDLPTTDAELEAGTLSEEVSGTNYARQTVSFSVTGNQAENSADVTFPAAGTGGYGEVTHVAVLDSLTAGNVLFWGRVTTPKTIEENDTFVISTNNLTISLD